MLEPATILMDLSAWDAASNVARRQAVAELSLPLDFAFEELMPIDQFGQRHLIPLFWSKACNNTFVLLPGARATLGSSPARRDAHPQRTAEIKPFIIETETILQARDHQAATNLLENEHGGIFRLPTIDEWEYACRGGTTSLYRWGEHHPIGADPSGRRAAKDFDLHKKLNGFGLSFPHDTYRWEYCADPNIMVGGDGGTSISGPASYYHAWRTLSSSYRCVSWSNDPANEPRNGYIRRVYPLPIAPLHVPGRFPLAAWDKWYDGEYQRIDVGLIDTAEWAPPDDTPSNDIDNTWHVECQTRDRQLRSDVFRRFAAPWFTQVFWPALHTAGCQIDALEALAEGEPRRKRPVRTHLPPDQVTPALQHLQALSRDRFTDQVDPDIEVAVWEIVGWLRQAQEAGVGLMFFRAKTHL